MSTPHRLINPDSMLRAVGFSHAVVPAAGRTIYLGGQTAHAADGTVQGETVVEQLDAAAANVVTALEAAGGRPEHLVSMQIFTSEVEEYRGSMRELGAAWRRHFGEHYPAAALFGIDSLFDPAAKVELIGIAVVPEEDA
jgi:enamine deaminase RidA (YjgF/YER057c/UK114 family)